MRRWWWPRACPRTAGRSDVVRTEEEAAWSAFLGSLVERGLEGVQLVVSDAHRGLRNAMDRILPGASWQRCRAHFLRNVLTRVPRTAQGMVGSLVRSVFSQDTPEAVRQQYRAVTEKLVPRFTAPAELGKRPRRTSSPSRRSPRRSGARSGPTTPSARSAREPTWWASSPTVTPPSASSAPSSPRSSPDATSPSKPSNSFTTTPSHNPTHPPPTPPGHRVTSHEPFTEIPSDTPSSTT